MRSAARAERRRQEREAAKHPTASARQTGGDTIAAGWAYAGTRLPNREHKRWYKPRSSRSRGSLVTRLNDGEIGYQADGPDDCFRAAVATVTQVPIEQVPDPRLLDRTQGRP